MSDEFLVSGQRYESANPPFTLHCRNTTEYRDDDNVDITVHLSDGSTWSGTLFTVQNVQTLLNRWRKSGEAGSGAYFWARGAVIVPDMTEKSVLAAVGALLQNGELPMAFDIMPTATEEFEAAQSGNWDVAPEPRETKLLTNTRQLAMDPEHWIIALRDGSELQVLTHGYSIEGDVCLFSLLFEGQPNRDVTSLRIPLTCLPPTFQ